MSWNDFTERYASGSRVAPAVTLTTQDVIAESSSISWNALTPAGTMLTIEVALSTDSGATWSDWQACTSGQAIPGLSELSSLANVQLQIKATLSTTDIHATPELQDLTINITTAWPNIAYGPNKSTLTAWDAISLAWKADRLSLVVNDAEAAIENPGLPTTFGSYLYIGSDRNGANAINTLVDELRIDKVYREVSVRAGWHKTGVPFYTSEDMKQWPGYIRAESDGIKVYDSENALRVLLGSWLKDAVRKYGLKIIGGEIYATKIQSGEEGSTSYIKLGSSFEPLEIVENGKTALDIWVHAGSGGMIQFYDTTLNEMVGQILPMDDTRGQGLRIAGRNNIGRSRDVVIQGRDVKILPSKDENNKGGSANISSNLSVTGQVFASSGFRTAGNLECGDITNKNLTAANTVKSYYIIADGKVTFNNALDVYGNTWIGGNFYAEGGTKDCVENTVYGRLGISARESPEVRYIDEGMGQLTNGECRVQVDPIFIECIEPHTEYSRWYVHLTPYADVDLYVSEIGTDYFVVKERNNGISTGAEFTWSLSATRKDYAHIRFMEVL